MINNHPYPQQTRSPKIWRMLLIITLLLPWLTHPSDTAWACSCVEGETVTDAVNRAHLVFAGEVTDEQTLSTLFSSTDTAYAFNVQEVWKGEASRNLVIQTAKDSAACGYNFNVGNTYLVYAYEYEGQLQTNLCSRTTELSSATEDLNILGSGNPPLPANNTLQDNFSWLVLAGIGMITLTATGYIIWKTRQSVAV
ncbi:MAG TPA: hypothetical protein VLL52_18635 [Anaerolineae bacterium]|nr:hypothetical protein [Anaerolineae bacterium]